MLDHAECRSRELANSFIVVSGALARARGREWCNRTASGFLLRGSVAADAVVTYCERFITAGNRCASQVSASGECVRCCAAEAAAKQRGVAAQFVRGPVRRERSAAGGEQQQEEAADRRWNDCEGTRKNGQPMADSIQLATAWPRLRFFRHQRNRRRGYGRILPSRPPPAAGSRIG